LGYKAHIVSSAIKGEAKDVAADWVRKTKKQTGKTCLIGGGETTVTIKGSGKGGRNQEFALAALRHLKNEKKITILSAGSDGTDGPTNAAGAIVSSTIYENAAALGLNINAFLSDNDSYHFFEKAGGHLLTGPTQTNVMDIIIALID
jgi:glycerate 2-kinase